MIRNAFAANEAEQFSSTFRGTEHSVQRHMGAYLHKLKHAPHELEKEVEKAEHVVAEDAKEIEHKAKRALSPQSSADEDAEEDEGWTSDHSAPTASTSGDADGRKRSKSPKHKHTSKPIVSAPRKTRRRSSMRKGMLGRAHLLKQKQPESSAVFEDSDGETNEGRGRSQAAGSSQPGDGLASRGSAKNLRIDVIRSGSSRRDESPAKSIRFADEMDDDSRSGARTPRSSILQENPSPHRQGSLDDVDSPKNKVTFELPEAGKT